MSLKFAAYREVVGYRKEDAECTPLPQSPRKIPTPVCVDHLSEKQVKKRCFFCRIFFYVKNEKNQEFFFRFLCLFAFQGYNKAREAISLISAVGISLFFPGFVFFTFFMVLRHQIIMFRRAEAINIVSDKKSKMGSAESLQTVPSNSGCIFTQFRANLAPHPPKIL